MVKFVANSLNLFEQYSLVDLNQYVDNRGYLTEHTGSIAQISLEKKRSYFEKKRQEKEENRFCKGLN
jgi:hypothetical protein